MTEIKSLIELSKLSCNDNLIFQMHMAYHNKLKIPNYIIKLLFEENSFEDDLSWDFSNIEEDEEIEISENSFVDKNRMKENKEKIILDLIKFPNLNHKQSIKIGKIIANISQVNGLILQINQWQHFGMIFIFLNLIPHLNSITFLDISCFYNREYDKFLHNFISECFHLKSFIIRKAVLSEEFFVALSSSKGSIKTLEFPYCCFDLQDLYMLIKNCTNLTKLSLFAGECIQLKSVVTDAACNIEEIDLIGFDESKVDELYVKMFLNTFQSLKAISIGDYTLRDAPWYLSETDRSKLLLYCNKSIERLSYTNVILNERDQCFNIERSLLSYENLRCLRLIGIKGMKTWLIRILTAILRKMYLEELDLDKTCISQSLKDFTKILPQFTGLKKLIIDFHCSKKSDIKQFEICRKRYCKNLEVYCSKKL